MIRERHNVLSMLAVVEDTEKDILALFRSAAGMGIDLLVVTGGLGPTLDDLTREAVANYLGEELVLNEQAVSWMDEALTRMNGRRPPFRKERLKMAMVPKGARALRNVTGAACGIEATKDGMTIFCFPGFPNEMVPMFKEYVLPKIQVLDNCELEMQVWRGEASMEPLFQEVAHKFEVRIASLPCVDWKTKGNRVIIKGKEKEAEKAFSYLKDLLERTDPV